jgi:hypothetical protein
MSAVHLIKHRTLTIGFAWLEPIVDKRASVWWIFALAKIEALKEHELHWSIQWTK